MSDANVEAETASGTAIPGEIVPGSAEEAADFEARARELGWKDRSEFDRPPARWVDAKTFIERGESALPILKENLHRLENVVVPLRAENQELKAQISALGASVDHLRDLALNADRNAFERAKREFDTQKRNLETAIDDAAAKADVATVRTAREALATLQPPTPTIARQPQPDPRQAPGPSGPQVDPVEQSAVANFVASEKWFRTRDRDALNEGNAEASDFAGAAYTRVKRERPDLAPAAQLLEVKKAVSKRFPEIFANERAERPASVSAPSGGNGIRQSSSSGARWEDIPSADRTLAEKMIADVNKGRKDGKTFSKAEYATMYFKGQG